MLTRIATYLIFSLFFRTSFAQGMVDTIYYNREFEETTERHHLTFYALVKRLEDGRDTVEIRKMNHALYSRQTWRDRKMEGRCIWFHENGQMDISGNYHKSKRIGKRDYYDVTGFHIRTEVYNKQHKVTAEYYTTENNKTVYTLCDRQSSFGDYRRAIKAQRAMGEFITVELIKPAVVDQIVDPVVVVDFLISPIGSIEDVAVVYTADERLNGAVLAVMAKMPEWSPARFNNQNVYSQMSISVSF